MKNQSVPHIQIVQHPNPEMRTYHVTRQASKVHRFGFGVDQISPSRKDDDPGILAKRLAKALEQIPGITQGSLDAYEIDITKGSAFKWDEVSPLVLGQIVKRLFPKCVGNTIEISTTVHYMAGEYSRNRDIAVRCEVPVSFGKREKWPQLDIETLFKSSTLTKVIDNTGGESASATAGGEKAASA